jgi:predicted DNA-binding transcriptional regulator YafY
MPRSNTNDPRCARTRILQLLRLLSRHDTQTAAVLHDRGEDRYGWEVNLKTVKRDLEVLADLGLAESEERGAHPNAPRGWRAARDGATQLPLAVSSLLMIGRPHLDLLPPENVAAPLHQVIARSQERAEVMAHVDPSFRFARKVRVIDDAPLATPEIEGLAFGQIKSALHQERCVAILHEDAAGAARSVCVEPRGLVVKGSQCFLVATDPRHGLQGLLYPVDRILRADPVDAGIRPGFDLDAFLKEGARALGARQTPVRLRARVSARMAARLRRERLAADQSISAPAQDGWCMLAARVVPDQPLLDFLCANARDLVIEAPVDLRARIRKQLQVAVETYDSAP